jgi:hypothetical protein
MSADGSLWYVKLADGDVGHFTLDELDEAFQTGRVDENSMVLAAGSDQWMKLADLLGLSEVPPQATPPPQAPIMQQPTASPRPLAGMPASLGASSLRPVSVDLGHIGPLDLDEVPFRTPSRKRWVALAFGTALVVGASAFFVVSRTAASAASSPAPDFRAAAMVALPVPAPEPAKPVSPPLATTDPIANANAAHFSEEQKKKLLEADQKMKSRQKAHAPGGSAVSHASRPNSPVFTTSGNKYDPLNSSL